MAIKIIMGVLCNIPMSLILFGVFWFEGKPKGNLLFGVTLWQDGLEDENVKRLQKDYKRNLHLVNLTVLILFIFCCIPKRDSIVLTAFLCMMLVNMVLYYVPFALANRRLMRLKLEKRPSAEERFTVSVDMKAAAINEPVLFKRAGIVGMVLGMVPVVIEAVAPRSPDMKGWNLAILITMGLAGVLLFAMLIFFNRMKTDVVSRDSSVNIQLARVRKYQFSKVFVIVLWINMLFNFYLLVRMGNIYVSVIEIIAVTLLYTAVGVIFLLRAQLKVMKVQKMYADSCIQDDGEDKYWLFGMFYYNKHDNRFWVNTRVGTGKTFNLAKPAGKICMVIIGIVMLATIIGSSVMMLLIDFTPVSLTVSDGVLVSEQFGEEYTIAMSDIKEAELLDELPDMSKRVGTAMENILKGSFAEKGGEYGKCEVCIRINGGPYIRLRAGSGLYYLNDENPDTTREIYDKINQYIQEAAYD